MSTIKAPFNFVPLSENVFFPDWSNQISQDIPFSDGLSGKIELTITAESPVFVRNGHLRTDVQNREDDYLSFSKTKDGRHFIPSTSIKGMIRNVLEIISFSKMNFVSNKRYSIRDLKLDAYKSYFQHADIHCGWMRKEQDEIKITDHGIPRRISHKEIDDAFGTSFCEKFANSDFLKNEKNKSSLIKYLLFKDMNTSIHYKELPLNPNNAVDQRLKVHITKEGDSGKLVFTGQPGIRKPAEKGKNASGKYYEFVFPKAVINSFEFSAVKEDGLYNDFCFVYKDSEEWHYWKKQLEKGESIPVFFAVKNDKILHFGLSYLYKLPYLNRVKEYLYDAHKEEKADLSECIFGSINNYLKLKGRVQFSHAFCLSGNPVLDVYAPYMGSPKPTYYPIYLKQQGVNGYMSDKFVTMLDKSAKLKGWKRYPVRDAFITDFRVPEGQEQNTNPFIPLQRGSCFKCFVNYHNLRPIELGALLSAIELRQGEFHTLGFAKSFGFGQVKVTIDSVIGDKYDVGLLKKEFENLMNSVISNYSKSEQRNELMAMMRSQDLIQPLEYMELKEFVECKKQNMGRKNSNQQYQGEYLQPYSELIKKKITPKLEKKKGQAEIKAFSGSTKQARLIEGKDLQVKPLEIPKAKMKDKLKIGNMIEVEIVLKSGKIQQLIYVKKID